MDNKSIGKRYVYYNANPADKVTNDCVIRALAVAFDKPWIDVFDELTSIARENFDVATSKDVYMEYVKKHGAEYIKTMTKYSRLSGGDFADQYQEGVYRFSRVKAHDFNRGMKPVLIFVDNILNFIYKYAII